MTDNGRAPSGQALVASDGAAAHLHPTGFDPSREFTEYMLNIIADCEWHDGEIFWHYAKPGEPRRFFALCNDFFFWGCGDAERITPETLPILELAIADCRAADKVIGDCYAHELYCARMRKLRPQGACYKTIEPQFWPLFDAAGPERKADFGNPLSRASAIEARRAATENTGAVHESAGPKDDAQPQSEASE